MATKNTTHKIPRKAVPKKITKKKATKRTYARKKPVAEDIAEPLVGGHVGDAMSDKSEGTTAYPNAGSDEATPLGSYSSSGFLKARATDQVHLARGALTARVRQLCEATVRMATNTNRDNYGVLEAEQALASARFEQAVNSLEKAIRG